MVVRRDGVFFYYHVGGCEGDVGGPIGVGRAWEKGFGVVEWSADVVVQGDLDLQEDGFGGVEGRETAADVGEGCS